MLLALVLIPTLTLQDAWQLASTRNPSILEARAYSEEMDYLIESTRSRVYPKVEILSTFTGDLNPGFLNSKDFQNFIDSLPEGFEYKPEANYLYDISFMVTQDLYTGGTIRTGLKAARLANRVADNRAFRTTNSVLRDVAETYANLYLLNRTEKVYDLLLKQQELFLDQVRIRYDIGDATALELLKAEVALSSVYPDILRTEEQQTQALFRLNELTGHTLSPDSGLEELPVITIDPRPEELLPYALEHHPDVVEIQQSIEEARLRESLVTAEGKPQASLSGGYGYSVADTDNFGDPLYKAWNIRIQMSLSLFDGFDRKYRKLQQHSRVEQLNQSLVRVQSRVERQIRTLLKQMETSEKQLQASRYYFDQAAEALRVARENFEIGAVTQLEVLDAQRENQQAHLDFLKSQVDMMMTRINLLYESGIPLYKEKNHENH